MATPISPPSDIDIDHATRRVTAHRTFADLLARPSTPTLRAEGSRRRDVLTVRQALHAEGKDVSPAWGSYRSER